MVGQFDVVEAEGGHERGMMRGEEARVIAQVQIGGRNALGVVVGGSGRGAVGVVDQGTLQLVGNDAEIVVVHVRQRVDAGLDCRRGTAWRQRRRRWSGPSGGRAR